MAYYRFTRLQQYINGQPTDVYTKGERVDNVDYSTYEACMGSSGNSRWVSIPQTVCYNGDLWSMEKEQISYDGGITWNDTGNTRRASVIEPSASQCSGADNDWRVVYGEYVCNGTTKCLKEAEYIDNLPTGRTRAGSIVELLSEDCGVMYQWVNVPNEYVCVYKCGRGDKYTKQKQQYSLDNGVHWEDTGETREGDFIEKNSADCGCDTSVTRWVTVSGEYVCVGTSKYTKEKEQTSTDGTNWTDTGNTRAGSLIEVSSTDCASTRWVTVSGQYSCVGTDKYNLEKEQQSTDGGTTWTDTGNTRAGSTLIEANSTDCGYTPTPITRWVADTGYVCVGYNKMNKEKEQISYDSGSTWSDTGNTRAGSNLIETNSEDCGYITEDIIEDILEDYENVDSYPTKSITTDKDYFAHPNTCSLNGGQYLLYEMIHDGVSVYHYELNLFDTCTATITNTGKNVGNWPSIAGSYLHFHYYDNNDIYYTWSEGDVESGIHTLYVKRQSDNKTLSLSSYYTEAHFSPSVVISPTELFTVGERSIYFYNLDWVNERITLANTVTIESKILQWYPHFSYGFWQPELHLIGFTMILSDFYSYYNTVLIDTSTHQIIKNKTYKTLDGINENIAARICINHSTDNIEAHYANGEPICVNKDTMKYGSYITTGDGSIGWDTYKYNYRYNDGVTDSISDKTPYALLPCYGSKTRWINIDGETICNGFDKCKKQKEQTSSDGGSNWTDTGNIRAGEIIQADSTDCGYIPPNKAYLVYQNNKDKYVTNDSTGILTRRETGGSNASSSDYYIKKLLTAEISNAVTTLGTACFSGAGNLTSVTVPSSVTMSQGSAFVGTKITTFSASGMTGIADSDFNDCSLLTSVSCPNATTIGYRAFAGCRELTSLNLGAVTTIGDSAFLVCTKLIYSIPSTVTSIGEGAFAGCDAITSVVIPSGVTELKINTFQGCDGITSVNLGNVQTLGKWVFRTCTSLQSITIPATVTTLGDYVFEGCSSLTSITVLATTPPTAGSEIFKSTSSSKIIYVPAESVEAYKIASGWSTYASKIQAIS